ncbi:hypothetical protein DdX_11646 [Ditylenchus destructor]|uniref:Uncharacterized protein n=1 Tax=Ditylenchus destructor TaxID=166010 RepID=A0AAD4R4F4_9BILA|nr:hypothetical protein DdX_11646 [Ditylenchus destructor]
MSQLAVSPIPAPPHPLSSILAHLYPSLGFVLVTFMATSQSFGNGSAVVGGWILGRLGRKPSRQQGGEDGWGRKFGGEKALAAV